MRAEQAVNLDDLTALPDGASRLQDKECLHLFWSKNIETHSLEQYGAVVWPTMHFETATVTSAMRCVKGQRRLPNIVLLQQVRSSSFCIVSCTLYVS
jgi:hypothetical protein